MAKKILITDDHRDLFDATKMHFENEGYEVVTAYDEEECLIKVKTEHPDLIILDISILKTNEYTVTKAMKMNEDMKHIPIIVLTEKNQMEDLFQAEGIKVYIVKPFQFEVLIGKVKDLLQESEAEEGAKNS